jgi:hypothetical protein
MWFNNTATKIGNIIRLKENGWFLSLHYEKFTDFLKKRGVF